MTTFIWSDNDRYERAAGTDGITAWTWTEPEKIEPENGLQGWAVFFGDSLIGAGQVNTAEEARQAAERCVAARISRQTC
jgi:hypothetical protein